ncbi:MAG TPA: xanthine dehydrogenase family protein subunit M [Bryobacteraceae bacterium]|jgi:aerobic carbon-monoxide dehydrogenase medium subunit|nr:xanthine dehydrogenase family protein subunit M [Bryobacteraceae bacterium]
MIPQTFEYTSAATLDQALGLIAQGAKPLAGGMSLIPMMKLRLAAPEHLVDIGRIKELNYIREQPGSLHIGAAVTHYEVESSPLVRGKCPLLAETAGHIGDVQVRNMGTIGGSIAHADPSADYPAALQALEAKIVLRGAKSQRTIPFSDFLVDAFSTAIEPGEIVSEVIVPVDSAGTSYQKLLQPASGFAIVGVAARIERSGGKITRARVGVTGLSNHAYRAAATEKMLEGRSGSAMDIQHAAAMVAEGADANSDLHASADYRRHLATVYAARAITAALARTA